MRNRIRMRLRRLKEPRYLLGMMLGLAYFYWVFWRPRGNAGFRQGFASMFGGTAGIELALVTLLFLLAALSWAWPRSTPALPFTRADVQWLFTAPISRRRLVAYRLWRSKIGALVGSLIFTLLFRPSSVAGGWTLFLGMALMMTTVSVHLTGVSLSRDALRTSGLRRLTRRWLPPAVVAAAVLVIGTTVATHWTDLSTLSARGGDLTAELQALSTSGATGVVLWPFHVVARLPLAGSASALLAQLPVALALLGLNYVWVLRADVAFEEASAELADRLDEMRRRGPRASLRPRAAKPPPFALAPTGPVETAILWKNLIRMGRFLSWRLLLRLSPAIVAMAFVLGRAGRSGNAWNGPTILCLVVAGMALLLGPQIVRSDLRHDLTNLDVLKTWPVPGAALVRGEILAPAIVLTVMASLALIVATVLSTGATFAADVADRWSLLAAALMVAPGIVLAELLVQNALAVTFPSWVVVGPRRGGIDIMGQRMLLLAGMLLVLVLAVLPAALVAGAALGIAYLATGTILVVAPGALAGATLLVEVYLATELVGDLLDRTDIAALEAIET